MKKTNKAFHEQVAENLIEQLKKGVAPWQKPWKPGDLSAALPFNPTTAKRYRGINNLNLISRGYTDPRWLTYKQAEAAGAQVRKGQKSTPVQYWLFAEERIKTDEQGVPILDSEGQPIKEHIKLERSKVFYAAVFNAEQIDNLPELVIKAPDWDPLERAEDLLQHSQAIIHHGEIDDAFYRPSTDSIHLPHKHQFPTAAGYYQTALHELGHWSGHESRLNRDLFHPFGSEGYAREELRAEIASMLLGGELGIGHDPGQHVTYVGAWIKALQDDPLEIFRAAADAEKIREFVLALSHQQEIDVTEATKMDPITYTDNHDHGAHKQQQSAGEEQGGTRQYLVVPYKDKELAKFAGARWDKKAKAWYVGPDADIEALQPWLPENVALRPEPAIDPIVEFAELLRTQGCQVDGNHPVMDGQTHRIKVAGDKRSEKSGFYVAHLDGRPAGYFKNNRTGIETRWKAKGYSLTDEQKAELFAQAAIKLQIREAEHHAQHIKIAQAIQELLTIAPNADVSHSYLVDKNARAGDLKVVPQNGDLLPADSIIKIASNWQEAKQLREDHPECLVLTPGDLLLSAQDVDGSIWSVQTIQANGTKLFAAGSKKEHTFHIVGNNGLALDEAINSVPTIVIAEGYATADTVSQALNQPVIAAFDSGNLPKVAQDLHAKFPSKPIIIAGDDDLHLESTHGKNPGREKALEAAQLVNGVAVFPVFAPGEQMKSSLSDFNDLVNQSVLGLEAVKRQVGSAVERVLRNTRAENLQTPTKLRQETAQKRALAR
ncbi:DUF1738 domain-containing protein [Nitrosomonas sp. JL21]|uniref:zincin-like metallopeptidase domain-containing protein n=1 Tax=Nitrosomonas sp. JL21 TaxID=153949 RepID=UPI00136C2349|nr:zincin-like metallopeptidase domain-containing protein [Nitrosomonas sp. JL21]MXS78822.1 DUF1738 domain-containing protein [Nitrosomonas sp. JL21]